MGRHKAFDKAEALASAIDVFASHGYEGTSTDALVAAMGISRQSLYDTFGDKWRLYLAAVQQYSTDSVTAQLKVLNGGRSAMAGLRRHLMSEVQKAIDSPDPKCLGVSSTCEFGRSRPELNALHEVIGKMLVSSLEHRLEQAKQEGDIAHDAKAGEIATFILAMLVGVKVLARGGASPDTLRGIARVALDRIR